MKSFLIAIAVLALSGTALAQGSVSETPELPVDAENVDFTGTWHYSTGNHQVSGHCPVGQPMDGTLAITQSGGAVGVMITSGARCDPASMCMFDGGIEEGQLLVSNTAIVDDEGGSASNALRLFFTSESAGGGESASGYVHPKGFECQWSHNVMLWRSEE